jgi:hypothetical protein
MEAVTKATQPPLSVLDNMAQFDPAKPYAEQARALANAVMLTGNEWQTDSILVNLPGHSSIAACLLAELHGRMGHFPAILRLRPKQNTTPQEYEMAEILNLQTIRDSAREMRTQE